MKSLRPSLFTALVLLMAGAPARPLLGQQYQPPYSLEGFAYITEQLGPGTYALLSNGPGINNSGFVVGEHGVLVIDGPINGELVGKIQQAVREVTDKPIRYVVNTNHVADHWWGNYGFPEETTIIAHREAPAIMQALIEPHKGFMQGFFLAEPEAVDDVAYRLPDVVFDDYMRIDLGRRVVELHHFGPGVTIDDVVVYVPEAKAAWTNMIDPEGVTPNWTSSESPTEHLKTLARFAEVLDVETIVPSHGPGGTAALTTGRVFGQRLAYTTEVIAAVRAAIRTGKTLEETLAAVPLSSIPPPPGRSEWIDAFPRMGGFPGIHLGNVRTAYEELAGSAPASSR